MALQSDYDSQNVENFELDDVKTFKKSENNQAHRKLERVRPLNDFSACVSDQEEIK